MKPFKKILIANRSEIAVRINKSAKLLGIKTVAVYADVEKEALHTQVTDESYSLGNGELKETYLNIDKIIAIAVKSGCDAIHPGYGFLAENPQFVEACNQAKITFIGPTAKSMRIMGNKIAAREFIHKINVPTTKGVTGDLEVLKKAAEQIPFPLLIKAAAGGGGKGMRIVHTQNELNEALESTSREALNYFGDGSIYIEQYIENPRHIEIQILGDNHGNVVHLFERECSIQRRYQKIIEESPSPTLTDKVRNQMGEMAVKIGLEIGYTNAGTIEFLVDNKLNFYFLEMNTRVQVEHPITEMVTGIDIVKEQILIAAGFPLSFKQLDVKQTGHAIETRIYAENPEINFMPSPGTMTFYAEPKGENIRIDTGINKATTIESFFDPMIGKLIVWEMDRETAINSSINALEHYIIHGINTNISFLKGVLQNDQFKANQISTHFCEDNLQQILAASQKSKNDETLVIPLAGYLIKSLTLNQQSISVWNAIGYWRDVMNLTISLDETEHQIRLIKLKPKHIEFEWNKVTYLIEDWQFLEAKTTFKLMNRVHTVYVSNEQNGKANLSYKGHNFSGERSDILNKENTYSMASSLNGENSNNIFSPMPGKIIKIDVAEGDHVLKGDNLLIVEAMKMENHIKSPKDAVISKINVKVDDTVTSSIPLIVFADAD